MTKILDNARRWAIEAGDLLMRHFDADHAPDIITGPEVRNFATQVDVDIQRLIRGHIAQKYPSHTFIGEEEGLQVAASQDGYTWVVDPLDGTLNFYFGVPLFVVAIGVLKQGTPHIGVIYDPYHGELYAAERGQGPALLTRMADGSERELLAPKLDNLGDAIVMTHLTTDDTYRSRFLDNGTLSRLATASRHIRMLGCGQLALSYIARGRFHAFVDNYTHPWDVVAGHVVVEASGGVVTDIMGNPWTSDSRSIVAACSPAIHRTLVGLVNP